MNEDKKVTMALIANRALRMGPGSPLIRFVREFEPFFREVLKPKIYTIEGSYRALIRSGLLHDYPDLEIVGAGQLGGLVGIAEKVVREQIDHVIYFIDPRDPTSLFPESIALKRECVVKKKLFLATYRGAREWASLAWFLKTNPPDRCFLSEEFVSTFLSKEREIDLIKNQTIALIAHNAKKLQMLEFAYQNFALLHSFKDRSATGTTGELLNGKFPEKMEEKWKDLDLEIGLYKDLSRSPKRMRDAKDEEEKIRSEVKSLASKLNGKEWVLPLESGPEGGDVQIAEKIRKKECHRVLFFEDPGVSREHEADIQLLERTARIPDNEMSIPCLHDEKSAKEWVDSISNYNGNNPEKFTSPLTLVEAYRRCFDIELVLASREEGKNQAKGAATEGPWKSSDELWDAILSKAAWYIQGLIALRAHEQQAIGSPARVGVTWGYSIYQLIDHINKLSETLQEIDRQHVSRALATSLSDGRFLKPGNVLVEPIVGIMGTTDLRVEANNNAARLARLLGAKEHPLTRCVFLERAKMDHNTLQALQTDQSERWDRLDVAIFTCDAVKNMFGTKATAMVPERLYNQMVAEAKGEIGGLYLDDAGNWVNPHDYERIGITHEQLRGVAQKGGAILIAGVQSDRRESVLAALQGKLVSVFVTDFDFAFTVLQAHLAVRKSPGSPKA
jgi:methylglyoxal synthase/DNA-binding transcriptional regulator LsrR (DeoR family)